jgi:hypothetical protein
MGSKTAQRGGDLWSAPWTELRPIIAGTNGENPESVVRNTRGQMGNDIGSLASGVDSTLTNA